jgi:3'(2'), 5'-bisphosphate nucleotidase
VAATSHPLPERNDHATAQSLVEAAAQVLVGLRQRLTDDGVTGRALGDAGDHQAQAAIAAALGTLAAGDAVLSEEAADDATRLTHRRVWIIDPLDGTREFTEPPRCDWAVHAALAVDGEVAAAAVALPATGEVFTTATPPTVPPRNSDQPLRIVVSRTRPPAVAEQVAAALGAELVPMGSAGAKTMAVVRGDADIYLHAGGQYEWDSCAPVGVAQAAGLHTSRLDGTALRYNQPNPWMPDLVVCRPELAAAVLDLVARHHTEPGTD